MHAFKLPRTALTPEVLLDLERRTLRIDGECYPEDPTAFFLTLLAAVRSAYPGDGSRPALHAFFRLSYVNSASTVWFRRLLRLLDVLAQHGVEVLLTWEYDADDDASLDLARDLVQGLHHLELVEQPTADAA